MSEADALFSLIIFVGSHECLPGSPWQIFSLEVVGRWLDCDPKPSDVKLSKPRSAVNSSYKSLSLRLFQKHVTKDCFTAMKKRLWTGIGQHILPEHGGWKRSDQTVKCWSDMNHYTVLCLSKLYCLLAAGSFTVVLLFQNRGSNILFPWVGNTFFWLRCVHVLLVGMWEQHGRQQFAFYHSEHLNNTLTAVSRVLATRTSKGNDTMTEKNLRCSALWVS